MDGLDGVFCGSQVESSIRFEDKIPQWLHEIFGRDNQSRAVKPGDHSDTLDFDFCHRR